MTIKNRKIIGPDKALKMLDAIRNRFNSAEVLDCYKSTKRRKRGFGYFLTMVADVGYDEEGYQGFDVDDLTDDEITVLFNFYKQKQAEVVNG